MIEGLTKTEEKVFLLGMKAQAEKGIIVMDVLSLEEYGIEREIEWYLSQNPKATFEDVDRLIVKLIPSLEIVDDNDMDE